MTIRWRAMTVAVLAPGAFLSLCTTDVAAQLATRDRVSIVGSSTLFPFASRVAESLRSDGRGPAAVVESLGTGGGFRLFCAGVGGSTPDVTDASRPITRAEAAECARNGVSEVVDIRVGLDGMLLASARRAPALSLTREQLYLALARRVPRNGQLVLNPYRRWRELSPELPDLPIRVYGPAPNHGTRDAFVALAIKPACERALEVQSLATHERQVACEALREDGAWIDVNADYAVLLRRLLADPEAVGVLGFSYLDNNRTRLQAARIDGVDPTPESITAGEYPLSRPLFIYVKRAHVGHVLGLLEFVQEFVSERAAGPQGYLIEQGLMPLPEDQRKLERAKVEQLSARR
jgi:phosphate transport system substrate-binding protein